MKEPVTASTNLRVLLVQSRGRSITPRDEHRRRQDAGEEPRSLLLAEVLGADLLDEEALNEVGPLRARVYRRLPSFVAQAVEARLSASRYDIVLSWSERHSVALAVLFTLAPSRTKHVTMTSLMSKPSVGWPYRLFRRGITHIITWSSVQQQVAVGLGYGRGRFSYVPHPVDCRFYTPARVPRRGIFSAGSTMRDFPTLIEAAEGLSTQIRIAASLVVHLGGLRATVTDVRETLPARADVSVSQLTALELRDAYRAAEVVVVPLYPSDMDNGVNLILEAMAAGRPVVASRIPGQVDVITHGKTGYYVDPENPEDLRRMLVHLRDNPEEAERVADEGRRYVASVHDLETFADNVRARLIEINGGQSSRATPWWAEASVSPDSLRTSGCRRSQTAGRLRASR